MKAETINRYREEAEVYTGHDICKEKLFKLLEELCLPKGLFPLKNIEEFGYNSEVGFVWLIQKHRINHYFPQKSTPVTYSREITAFVEKYRIKKISGVKIRELMICFSIVEVYFEDPESEELTFKTSDGIRARYLASAFELKD